MVWPSHTEVEFAHESILAALEDYKIVAPADFSHQWREIFLVRVSLEERLAPARPLSLFDDQGTNIPVEPDQLMVDDF